MITVLIDKTTTAGKFFDKLPTISMENYIVDEYDVESMDELKELFNNGDIVKVYEMKNGEA